MKKTFVLLAALWAVSVSAAWALPGSSVYPNADKGSPYGPVYCGAAGCHKSSAKFDANIFYDIRDKDGKSLMNESGEVDIPWKPGTTTVVHVVAGLKEQDASAKVAGWFLNLPSGVTNASNRVNYCYHRINYEVGSQLAQDKVQWRTGDAIHLTFHRYMAPTASELWLGVGGKATDEKQGTPERLGTLTLKTVKVNWVPAK